MGKMILYGPLTFYFIIIHATTCGLIIIFFMRRNHRSVASVVSTGEKSIQRKY